MMMTLKSTTCIKTVYQTLAPTRCHPIAATMDARSTASSISVTVNLALTTQTATQAAAVTSSHSLCVAACLSLRIQCAHASSSLQFHLQFPPDCHLSSPQSTTCTSSKTESTISRRSLLQRLSHLTTESWTAVLTVSMSSVMDLYATMATIAHLAAVQALEFLSTTTANLPLTDNAQLKVSLMDKVATSTKIRKLMKRTPRKRTTKKI